MRRRKKVVVLLAGLACLGGLCLTAGLLSGEPEHEITRAVTDRIQLGMTADEAEALMGMPPGFYREDGPRGPGRQRHSPPTRVGSHVQMFEVHESMHWWLEGVTVILGLDENERVVDRHVSFQPVTTRVSNRFWRSVRWLRWPGNW